MLKEMLKKEDKDIDLPILKEELDTLLKASGKNNGIDSTIFFTIRSKKSYYQMMFDIYEMGKEEETKTLLLKDLRKDLSFLIEEKKDIEKKKEALRKMEEDEGIYIDGLDILLFTQSHQGYYLIINVENSLRCFNLTNKYNGYHIFGTGNLCAGSIYRDLKEVLERELDIPKFISLLRKVLVDYDDSKYHTAPKDAFEGWPRLEKKLKKGILSEKAIKELLGNLKDKKKKIEELPFWEGRTPAFNFALDRIEDLENLIRSSRSGTSKKGI